MNPTISIGRIFGIRVGFNWSWFLVFGLIVWSLAAGVFPSQEPGHSHATYIAMGATASILFFTSLLLHEFGHAIRAKREGMVVEDVTLWLFGGVARFSGEFPNAAAEFRIAIAGPLVTLVIGSACLAATVIPGLPATVDGVASWLGYINFLLLGFNLLPALPLDGGRVLRSALWQRRGDFASATRTAASVSRMLAFGLVGGGFVVFLAGGGIGALWLAFIGWFLMQAAGSELRFMLVHEALAGLRVRDLMQPNPVVVHPGRTIAEFMAEVAGAAWFASYPVVAGGEAIGVLPFRNVLAVPSTEWGVRLVRECMIPATEMLVFAESDAAVDAFERLAANPLQRGIVLEHDGAVGLLSITDIARTLGRFSAGRAG